MIYHVVYSARMRQDLRNSSEYTVFALPEPDTSSGQTSRIMKAVHSFNKAAVRHKLQEERQGGTVHPGFTGSRAEKFPDYGITMACFYNFNS